MGDLDHVSFGGETVDRRTRAMLREAQRIANEQELVGLRDCQSVLRFFYDGLSGCVAIDERVQLPLQVESLNRIRNEALRVEQRLVLTR